MKRREFIKSACAGAALASMPGFVCASEAINEKLNILFFTADDLGRDSLGCFGGRVADLTPNLDKFASEGIRFERGHVTVAICQPSRGVLATGLYGHNSGVMGFMHTEKDIPTVMQTLGDAGYLTGILGKVGHSTPKVGYEWDFAHDQKELGNGRSPQIYHDYCEEFFKRCSDENRPFYFMVNSHDPHRPFHVPGETKGGSVEPSRVYTPEEVEVPGFLPDLPEVRRELSYYQNSVRRLDDTFGKVMQALKDSGFEDNTLVMFLSDNGMAVPFAKCNAYLASTNTPWIVRWPGVAKPGQVDKRHFISGIDFFPTVLDAIGLKNPGTLDGTSFVPLLKGKRQPGRGQVFTQIDSKAGGDATPMRCVQDDKFGYIFNGWSDGERWYRNNNEGICMAAMNEAAETDPEIAARVEVFRHRSQEELYDLQNDPDCLNNLAGNPEYKTLLSKMQARLVKCMKDSNDPVLDAFEKRESPDELTKALTKVYGDPLMKPKKTKEEKKKNAAKKK